MNNRRNKFLCHAFKNDLIENKYGIKSKCAITTNPQENLILERINKVIANLVHMFDSQKNYLDEDEPWAGILAATAFVVHSMYDTKLWATPGQLVLVCDMILNTPFVTDWEDIMRCK